MNFQLVQPDETMLAEIAAYKAEMLAEGSTLDGCGALTYLTPEAWLTHCRSLLNEAACPPGWTPATQYVALDGDRRIIGMIDLRHRLNDFLAEYGGHIGYSVRPGERRKGVATRMLAEVLQIARDSGMRRVLVTCDAGNEASRRTIERCGGVFERTTRHEGMTILRFWIEL